MANTIDWQPIIYTPFDVIELASDADKSDEGGQRMSAEAGEGGATPTDVFAMTKGELGASFATMPDAEGYILSGYIYNDGFSAVTRIFKRKPNGPAVAKWMGEVPRLNLTTREIDPNGVASKADGAAATIAGADGFVFPTTHTTNPPEQGPRLMVYWTIDLPGQFAPVVIGGGSGTPAPAPTSRKCSPKKLPYFDANKPLTRAQAATVIARALAWEAQNKGQMFEDVPADSDHRNGVNALAERGVMRGYDCTP